MKTLYSWWLCATAALFTAAKPVSAQTPPKLGLRLFAGVTITGAVRSIHVVQSASDLAQTNSWTSLAFLQLPATIRGAARDEFESNCRSAKRMGFGVSPFLKDYILGFRVVLACP